MTANLIKGKGFRGALRYNMEKVAKEEAEVLDHSFGSLKEKAILKEVLAVKVQRPSLQKYFYHTSINFPYHEKLSNQLMKQIGQDFLEKSGFDQHQYLMFRHYDADHPHLHILVNRIGYDGSVVSDSNDYARCEKVLRELEKKYGLTEVVSSKQAQERAVSKDELLMMKRTNSPSAKMAMQHIIKEVLKSKSQLSTNEFISKLDERGVKVLFNQASTGYVSGISYSYQGMVMQGSKLGNVFKWSTIKNTINYEQERDRQRIHETNIRSEHELNKLRAGNKHAHRDPANAQGSDIKYGQLPDSTQINRLYIFSPSFAAGINKHANQSSESQPGRVVKAVPEIQKSISLASLLDSHNRGRDLSPANQSSGDDDCMKKKRKKKKRRGLRM
ncbi:relaxase/mobilization nuclease domain-containing protein [Chryseosolibacter indicus]|uniref:Relaxase/mobilization nuclease domain-containing protein n=1 Tax=Chryseosolibacter indicus TaxID=2782351 RepID=A0ABS5VVM7_9BACT|nr:relaxase/mobilization nuclease domain-containing protein [Chryseosolibacter indicus]MBT1705281.1 relaxase/mobilization nuclease domain-containing protein [Chryseosolibacter indicus]